MVLIVVLVFAMLAGFLITSTQNLERVMAPSPPLEETTQVPATDTPPPPTSTAAPDEGFRAQVRAARLFDQIAHQVELQRALAPRAEVPLSFLDEGEMEAVLRERYGQEDRETRLLPYQALGLLPELPSDLQVEVPAGIYIPEHKQLYVKAGGPESDAETQALLAHGYVHALQDQHFDLGGIASRAGTTDERLALDALIEGDATLATALYSDADLSATDWDRWTDLIVASEQPGYGSPAVDDTPWTRLRRFANQEGRQFATALFERGGWDAVNQAYTDPPRSTELVLHPSRYLGGSRTRGTPEQPRSVVVPDLSPVLGEGWQMVVEDTLGEFVVGLYLNQAMTEEKACDAADGWDGDTLLIWSREDGSRVQVWRSLWSDTGEAREFEQALVTIVPQRHFPVRPIAPPRGGPGRWWQIRSGTVHLRREGRYVVMICAPDTNTLINLLEIVP